MIRKSNKRFFGYFLVSFLVLSLLFTCIAVILQVNTNAIKASKIKAEQTSLVEAEKNTINNRIDRLISDLLYISDTLKINEEQGLKQSILEKQWVAFSNRKTIYDQIRYIDENGHEKIKISYNKTKATVVKKNKLEVQKDEGYFKETMNLKDEGVYLSRFELSENNGKIETPEKPIIRIATPIYINGKKKGIVIMNFLTYDFLAQLKYIAKSSSGNVFLLNSHGYWLMNENDPDKEWTFMYKNKMNISFANRYPIAWKKIIKKNSSSFTTIRGAFTYTSVNVKEALGHATINRDLTLGDGDFYVVSYIAPASESGVILMNNFFDIVISAIQNNVLAYLLILILGLILSKIFLYRKNASDEITFFSQYDEMTHVLNRRAGHARLFKAYEGLKNVKMPMALCFIDINGLKSVNDQLGHEAGDELITTVIECIRSQTRAHDIIARFGGDEFIILFSGIDISIAEDIWLRILDSFNAINNQENRPYVISASHGIESIIYDSHVTIDDIIHDADVKMYTEKRHLAQERASVIRK